MRENSSRQPAEAIQALDWQARREALIGSTAYWSLLDELSAEGRFDHSFADEAATAILCLMEQQVHLRAGMKRTQLPEPLAELVLGCGGLQGAEGVLDPDDFVANVADALSVAEQRAYVLVRGVFAAVRRRLTLEEIAGVARLMPPSLRPLWRGNE
jgi:uncharacterized protein (DUF2267 family)